MHEVTHSFQHKAYQDTMYGVSNLDEHSETQNQSCVWYQHRAADWYTCTLYFEADISIREFDIRVIDFR